MKSKHVTGDLFDPAHNFEAIGHGVNCKGLMGGGIAVEFRRRYPILFQTYKRMCSENFLLPGMVMPYRAYSNNIYIYNIASQNLPGPNAVLEYLEIGLKYVCFHMEQKGMKRLGLPRIGAGIGGLVYEDTLEVISNVFDDSSVTPTIVSLP